MIVWNLEKWWDKTLVKLSDEKLKEFFAWSWQRRKMLLEKESGRK